MQDDPTGKDGGRRRWRASVWRIVSTASVAILALEIILLLYVEGYVRTFHPDLLSRPAKRVVEMGTGFSFTNDGLVLTSGHVVRTCRRITVSSGYLAEAEAEAKTSDFDALHDLAVLSIKDPRSRASVAGRSTFLLASDDSSAFDTQGAVFGYSGEDQGRAAERIPVGKIVRMTIVDSDDTLLAMSGHLRPGNSGSPVLNGAGQVVGVVARANQSLIILSDQTGMLDRGEAIPVSAVRSWLKRHDIPVPVGATASTSPVPLRIFCYGKDR